VTRQPLGQILHSFFLDHLIALKGLRPASIRSYRDMVRLLLQFVAADKRVRITRLVVDDLTFDRVQRFLLYLEQQRGNHIRTRNQRTAALQTLFEYIGSRVPEMLDECQRVAAIPAKRVAPAETRYLERDEVQTLLSRMPSKGRQATRDRALILFLYNTGARVQEVADLRVEHLDLGPHPRVRLHGKGDKWRVCPLWEQTARLLRVLIEVIAHPAKSEQPVFVSSSGQSLTRFGIYKLVCRHTHVLQSANSIDHHRRIGPHIFRHTTAVHLLESGVEINVIRGWLGHADLSTTNRYAEINTRTKEAALRACEPLEASVGLPRRPVWHSDEALLDWLAKL